MPVLYGIKNCDTVKKARKWLDSQSIDYTFVDFREDGLNQEKVEAWLSQTDWTNLLNKRSTTFRNLSEDQKNSLSEQTMLPLVLEQPTLIKRPVLEHEGTLQIGFKAEQYQALFGA